MILAALEIDWLSISINILLVIFVVICLLMSVLILMQRPKQEGLGAAFGGGVTDQVFGARTTNVLQRGTVYLGSLFFILAITLSILVSKQSKKNSLLENTTTELNDSAEVVDKDAKPVDVATQSLKDELPAADQNSAEVLVEPSEKNIATTQPVEIPAAPALEKSEQIPPTEAAVPEDQEKGNPE